MKILHIALNNLRQASLCDALQEQGEYLEIDWINEVRRNGVQTFRRDLITRAQQFKPDLTFMQLQTPDIVDPETAKQIPGYKVNWTGDVRQPLPQWYVDLGKVIDLSLFTNTSDVDAMRKAGCKADYLQTGFDQNIFFPKKEGEQVFDIVFMGNHYGELFPLSRFRYEMVHRLRNRYGEHFHLFGKAWDIKYQDLMYNQAGECSVYRRTKIAINLSHYELPRYSSDRNLRIMASGCFCLSHYWPQAEKDFLTSEIAYWRSLDDLEKSIDHYLIHEKERKLIATGGALLVHGRDTWHHRIKQLLDLIK